MSGACVPYSIAAGLANMGMMELRRTLQPIDGVFPAVLRESLRARARTCRG